MVDGGVNRWCILATSKTHPRMSPRGGEFREPQGYLPGPLPANKWSRRTTMMNCEFGSSPVCLQLPASVPTYVSGRGGGRGNVESIESDSYVLQTSPDHSGRNSRSDSTGRRGVPRGVHRRRGGGYHRVGGPGRGRGVGDPPLRSPPSGSGWGEGGSRPFSSFSVQNIQNTPHGAHLLWCPLRGFFGQNPPKPAKKALNVSRGVQKPAMWSLGRSFG